MMTHMEPIYLRVQVITTREVAAVIGLLKSGKAAGEDEIRPYMLKALNSDGILWLTQVHAS